VSYILEAIKKLEQQRQQEESPSILTLPGGTAQVYKKRILWPYITAGAILLNGVTAMALLWYVPRQQTAAAPKMVPVSAPVSSPETQPPASLHGPTPQKPDTYAPEKRPEPKVITPVPSAPQRALPSKPDRLSPAAPLSSIRPAPPKDKAAVLQGLPENLRNNLPDLKMTVHSYDDHPPSRFAIINNQNLREGEFIIPDLKLERITQDGAILNYQGHAFLLGIK
jgi:general secretion pathway protein B